MNGLQILSIILGFVGLAGGGAGFFWKSRGETVIQLQGKEIESYRREAEFERTEKEKLLAENTSLKQQNIQLIELAQGSPQLVKLIKEVRNMGQQMKVAIEKISNGNGK